jgi:hypothetical protein
MEQPQNKYGSPGLNPQAMGQLMGALGAKPMQRPQLGGIRPMPLGGFGGQGIDPGFTMGQMAVRPMPMEQQAYRGNPIDSFKQVNRPNSIRGQAQTAYNQAYAPVQAGQPNMQQIGQQVAGIGQQGIPWGQSLAQMVNYKGR